MHDIHSVGGGLQGLLSQLFQTLLPEIEGLILFGEKLDSFNSLYLLTAISHRLVISTESGAMMSELDETLKKALVCVRRLFDAFTVSRKKAIEEMKSGRSPSSWAETGGVSWTRPTATSLILSLPPSRGLLKNTPKHLLMSSDLRTTIS
jgi:hypothetical protein